MDVGKDLQRAFEDGYNNAINDVLEKLSEYDNILNVISASDLQGIICVIEQMKVR